MDKKETFRKLLALEVGANRTLGNDLAKLIGFQSNGPLTGSDVKNLKDADLLTLAHCFGLEWETGGDPQPQTETEKTESMKRARAAITDSLKIVRDHHILWSAGFTVVLHEKMLLLRNSDIPGVSPEEVIIEPLTADERSEVKAFSKLNLSKYNETVWYKIANLDDIAKKVHNAEKKSTKPVLKNTILYAIFVVALWNITFQ